MREFLLLGHDNPFGKYPAPVIPVGKLRGSLVAIYPTGTQGPTAEPLEGEPAFVKHEYALRQRLAGFDYHTERLFAYSEEDVVCFAIEEEKGFLRKFLVDPNFNGPPPFLRLVLAKQTGDLALILREMGRCSERLLDVAPNSAEEWCATEMLEVLSHVDWQSVNLKSIASRHDNKTESKLTVLVADDNPAWLDLLRATFEGEGFQVSSASDGADALDKIRRQKPDFVVLDLVMPGMTGPAVARQIRSDPALSETPVIFLTGVTDEEREQITGGGTYQCFQKNDYGMLRSLREFARQALKAG